MIMRMRTNIRKNERGILASDSLRRHRRYEDVDEWMNVHDTTIWMLLVIVCRTTSINISIDILYLFILRWFRSWLDVFDKERQDENTESERWIEWEREKGEWWTLEDNRFLVREIEWKWDGLSANQADFEWIWSKIEWRKRASGSSQDLFKKNQHR